MRVEEEGGEGVRCANSESFFVVFFRSALLLLL